MNGANRQNGVDQNGNSMDIIAEKLGKNKGNHLLNKSLDHEYKFSPARNESSSCHIAGKILNN